MALQPFSPGQPYTFNGVDIPSQQTLAPATAPTLAFRPSCLQLTSVIQAPTNDLPDGSVAYGVHNPHAQELIILNTMPLGLDQTEAHLYLDADGVCKLNGVDVPIVFKDMLPTPVVAETQAIEGEAQPITNESATVDPTLVFGCFILIAGLAYGAYTLWKRPKPVPSTSTTGPSPLQELVNLMKQPVSSDVEDKPDEQ